LVGPHYWPTGNNQSGPRDSQCYTYSPERDWKNAEHRLSEAGRGRMRAGGGILFIIIDSQYAVSV
jgi:hypothetical protein